MAKPAVTLRNTKGSALTFTEADNNFTNLRDATLTITDGSTPQAIELNGTITFASGAGISAVQSGGTVTITNTASSSALDNVVEDTSPQLGGNLDVNNFNIVSSGGGTLVISGSGACSIGGSVLNLTSNTSAGGNELTNVQLDDYKEVIYTSGTTTGTITPDVANGNVQSITLTGSITLNAFANAEAGQSLTLIVRQPGSGGPYTLTSTMKFAGGTKTLSTGANEIDIISIFYDGTTYYASLATDFS